MQHTAYATLLVALFFSQNIIAAQYRDLPWLNTKQKMPLKIHDGKTMHEVTLQSLIFAKSIKGQSPEFNDSNCNKGKCIRKLSAE